MELEQAVIAATEWAIDADASAHASALAQLARSLAKEIENPPMVGAKLPPPTSALAKELRATLAELEGMRDGDEAEADLAVVLSTPVRDATKSKSSNARSTRGKGGGQPRKATDAVAATRRRRGDGAAS